jgi:hypothetical protein
MRESLATILIAFIIGCFMLPLLSFWGGFIFGYFIKWTIGNLLIQGLSLLHITILPSQIPLLCGTLCIIGSYFRGNIKELDENENSLFKL